MVTKAQTLSTEVKVASASASFLLVHSAMPLTSTPDLFPLKQIRDQLQHHDHVITFSSTRTVSWEDYLVTGCLRSAA